MFVRRDVLRNFRKFTGKHLCQCLFLNKVAGQPATLLKKRLWHRRFPLNFRKFLWTPFLQNTRGRLLLKCLNKKISKQNDEQSYFSKKVIVWCFNISVINFIICFHTQWEVFLQIKFHPGIKFYSFYPEIPRWKNFRLHVTFIPGWNLIWKKSSHWVWKHIIKFIIDMLKYQTITFLEKLP